MDYQQTIDYLYSLAPAFHKVGASAYKPGLDNTLRLMAVCDNPHRAFPAVHVAGTNGKGSTSHLIAAALRAAGYRVGLYTSPHLVDFRERIRLFAPGTSSIGTEDSLIPEAYVVNWVEKYISPIAGEQGGVGSFFEVTTALAFSYFRDCGVDIAVVECGLGGRLDCTNVLTDVRVSVITNIGLDHTELLGDTLEKIAGEKAGIMKPGVPCVIGECTVDSVRAVFDARSAETGCEIVYAEECNYLRKDRQKYAPDCELQGAYQEKNLQCAFVALRALSVPHEAVAAGFAHVVSLTGLRGRWEILHEHPMVICDTGHNSHGIRTYVEQLKNLIHPEHFALSPHLYMVFGMVNDKDVEKVLDLLPKDAFYYWCQAETHRAIPSDEMRMMGLRHGLIGDGFGSVEVALCAAVEQATENDIVFIGGSNYVVGEAIRAFSKMEK